MAKQKQEKANEDTVENNGLAKKRYRELEAQRQVYVERAQSLAEITIPMLFPKKGHNSSSNYPQPFQSIGARGIKNLASKIVNALFPPNTKFWRYMLDTEAMAKLRQGGKQKTKLESELSRVEDMVQQNFEIGTRRAKLTEGALQLLLAGNVAFHRVDDSSLRVFRLDTYVVKRDSSGNMLEFITKEEVSPLTLPLLVRETCTVGEEPDEDVEVYTYVKLVEGSYEAYQEIEGVMVPGSFAKYPTDACPYYACRFYAVDGEDYARSYVEEHAGDLITLETLSRAITDGSVAAARILFLIRPGSATKASALERTANGGFVTGDANDISTMQLNKYNDFRVALELLNTKTESLSKAFMLNSSIQRQAERVTATEVQYSARELEDTLGGIYSVLAQELQLPMIRSDLLSLQRKGQLPALPKNLANPVPIGGLAALGRGNDADKLKMFAQVAVDSQQQGVINWGEYMERMATSLGVDTEGLIKTPEELQQEQMQAFMAQAGQAAAPNIANAMLQPQAAQ